MKVKYQLQTVKKNALLGMTEDSIKAAEVIDQTVSINDLAHSIAQASPAIDETIATMVLMQLPKVILQHCLESHNVQLGNPMSNEVAMSIHPDVKLDWQVTDPDTGKQKSVAFTLTNVRKYLGRQYATLEEAMAEIQPTMLHRTIACDIAAKYVQQFTAQASLQRVSKTTAPATTPDTPSTNPDTPGNGGERD